MYHIRRVKLGSREGWTLFESLSTQLYSSISLNWFNWFATGLTGLVHRVQDVCPDFPRLHVNSPVSKEIASLSIIVSNIQVRKPYGPS